MRVTYQQELKVKKELEQEGIEHFLPMTSQLVDVDGSRVRKLLPAVHNLIFIRSSQERITEMKMYNKAFEPLRYMVARHHDASAPIEIIRVPDHQMENFMRVASVTDDSVFFLDWQSVADKVGRPVMVTQGPFADVEGVVKRVRRNKHVVVELKGVSAVAIAFVPPAWLKPVNET